MKKIIITLCISLFVLVCTAFMLPNIKKVNELPDEMVVTFDDVEQANTNEEYSPFINLI